MNHRNTIASASLAALTAVLLAAAAMAQSTTAPNTNNLPGATHQTPMGQDNGATGNASATPQSSSTQEMALNKVQDPKTALASAKVEDSSGQTVGTVSKVDTSKTGKAESIEIALNTPTATGKTAKIKASQLQYDSMNNTLKAKLSQSQIEANASSPGTP